MAGCQLLETLSCCSGGWGGHVVGRPFRIVNMLIRDSCPPNLPLLPHQAGMTRPVSAAILRICRHKPYARVARWKRLARLRSALSWLLFFFFFPSLFFLESEHYTYTYFFPGIRTTSACQLPHGRTIYDYTTYFRYLGRLPRHAAAEIMLNQPAKSSALAGGAIVMC